MPLSSVNPPSAASGDGGHDVLTARPTNPSSVSPIGSGVHQELPVTVNRANTTEYPSEDPRYLVYTPSCRIPRFDPRDPSVLKAIRHVEPLVCGKDHPIFASVLQGNVLHVNTTVLETTDADGLDQYWSCCFSVLQRTENGKTDDGYKISSNCTPIEGVSVVLTDEFVRVVCSSNTSSNKSRQHVDFLYTIPLKESVEKRACETESRLRRSEAEVRPYSVMLIGMDAVSRLNFERHLNRTRRFLLDEMDAFEMMGYNKVGENTFPNLAALLTGYSKEELRKTCWNRSMDSCSWAWTRFSELGFRTLYGEDVHGISTFNYLKEGFYKQPTDYYYRPFSLASEKEIVSSKGLNTYLCLGSRAVHEVTIGWGHAFMDAMWQKPYFGLIWSNSLTHDYVNHVQRADRFLTDMLVDLLAKQRLNDTVLILFSDHGIRWGDLRNTRIGGYEERLPALYIVLPARFKTEFPGAIENLRHNSQRLTSTFDLHKTLLALASLGTGNTTNLLNASWMSLTDDPLVASRGISLFEEVPWNRTCAEAGVNGHWCACEEYVPLDIRSSLSLSIAAYVVDHVNAVTLSKRDLCSELKLGEVTSLMRKTGVDEEDKHQSRYAIVLSVVPSQAVFEATVVQSNEDGSAELKLESEMSRVNMYGNQSYCVGELSLKPFCFCRQFLTEQNATGETRVRRIARNRGSLKVKGESSSIRNVRKRVWT